MPSDSDFGSDTTTFHQDLMGIISYAQNFEDVLLSRVFAGLNYGFYVDIGAYHPVDDSVTKAFYDRGWSGINIEPGEIFNELSAARPRDINLNIAVYDRTGEIRFAQHPGWYAGLSHVDDVSSDEPTLSSDQLGVETRTVACDTLTNILERHGGRRAIAFIKIDAEGAELAIIRSTNWRVIRPTVLLIEATLPLSTELDNQDWEPILLEQGYRRAYFDGINCFYVPEERAHLLRCFELPVNVLDGFVRPDPPALVTLRDELNSAHERLAATSNKLASLQAENSALRGQNLLHVTTISTQDRILSELRQQFDDRVETVKAEYQRREGELQATTAAQLTETRGAWERQVALLQEDCEQRIRAITAKCTALEQRLMEMGQQEVILSASATRLHRLIFELRWPDGPRALRMVLPLARVIRRLKGTRRPDMSPALLVMAGDTSQGGRSPLVGAPTVAAPKRSLRKKLAWLVYRPLRPIIRPVLWRLRGFMIGEIIERLGLLDQRVVGLAEAPPRQKPMFVTAESRDDAAPAEMRRLAAEMERTLLTLALERAPEPWPLAPTAQAGNATGLTPVESPPAVAVNMSYVLHRGRTAFLREIPKGANVFLSAGCAGKWFFDWVEQCYGDIPRHIGLEYYTPRPEGLPANVEWIENTCSDMSNVLDSSCDVVFSGENLEHLWTDEAIGFFLEAARVTRPGGLLVMDSPNRSITEALRTWSHPEHTVELTTAEAVEVTELAGFDVVTVKGIWLSRDPRNGEVLPFQHTDSVPLSLEERLIGGVARPEDAFLWWIEARRADRAPDAEAVSKRLNEIFAEAWPERITRSVVGVGQVENGPEGEWVVCPPNTSGPLIFGPYMPLRAGRYRCTFELEGGEPAARARCDVAMGEHGEVLVSREMMVGPARESVSFEFEVPATQFGFQFRCFSLGGGSLRCRRVAQFQELTGTVTD